MQHYCAKLGAAALGVAILGLGLILWRIQEGKRMLGVWYAKYAKLEMRYLVEMLDVEYVFAKRSGGEWVGSGIGWEGGVEDLVDRHFTDLEIPRTSMMDELMEPYRIRLEGAGVWVWGVGLNKKDQGGGGDDLAFESSFPLSQE